MLPPHRDAGTSGGGSRTDQGSLGVALLRPKAALFADEPTTGLDAASALRVAALLRRCARRGFTVIAVLHQPRVEIVDALDAVLLLHRGRVAFAGPPKDVLERFRALGGNAVDLLLDNLKGDGDLALRSRETDDDAAVEILVDGGGGGPAAAEDVISEPPPSLAPPGLAGQCAVLCRRELRDARRDPAGVVSHAAPMALLGGLVALAYGDLPSRNDSSAGIVDRYGLAFLLVSAVALFSLSAAPKARRAALRARRDRDSHGAAPAFVAAAWVGDAVVLRLVPPLILGVAAVSTRCAAASGREPSLVAALLQLHSVCKSNLQPDFNVRVFECFDTSTSAVLRELAESNRFVQKPAESTSI